jgi:hypothetical protein
LGTPYDRAPDVAEAEDASAGAPEGDTDARAAEAALARRLCHHEAEETTPMTTAPRIKTMAGTITREPSPGPDMDEITITTPHLDLMRDHVVTTGMDVALYMSGPRAKLPLGHPRAEAIQNEINARYAKAYPSTEPISVVGDPPDAEQQAEQVAAAEAAKIAWPAAPTGQAWDPRVQAYAVSTLSTAGFAADEIRRVAHDYAAEWRATLDPARDAGLWAALREQWGPSFNANLSRVQAVLETLSGPFDGWLADQMERGHLSRAFVAAKAFEVHTRRHGREPFL